MPQSIQDVYKRQMLLHGLLDALNFGRQAGFVPGRKVDEHMGAAWHQSACSGGQLFHQLGIAPGAADAVQAPEAGQDGLQDVYKRQPSYRTAWETPSGNKKEKGPLAVQSPGWSTPPEDVPRYTGWPDEYLLPLSLIHILSYSQRGMFMEYSIQELSRLSGVTTRTPI